MSFLTVINFFIGQVLYQQAWWQRLSAGWYKDPSKCEMLLLRSKLKYLDITVQILGYYSIGWG